MGFDDKPKFSKCKDCQKPIEWKPSPKEPSKRWPFDSSGVPHFKTCEKAKPYIPKCKMCSQEIVWKPSERDPNKNLPFNKDGTSHLDSCASRKRQTEGASAFELDDVNF